MFIVGSLIANAATSLVFGLSHSGEPHVVFYVYWFTASLALARILWICEKRIR